MALNLYREVERANDAPGEEADLCFARHNSIVDALGPRVDPTLDGSGFDRTRLIKGLMFEAVRRTYVVARAEFVIFRHLVLLSRNQWPPRHPRYNSQHPPLGVDSTMQGRRDFG